MDIYYFTLLHNIILKLQKKFKTPEGKEALYKAKGALFGMMEGDLYAYKVFMKIMRWAYRRKHITEKEYLLCKKLSQEQISVHELPTRLNHIPGKHHPWQEFPTQKLNRR